MKVLRSRMRMRIARMMFVKVKESWTWIHCVIGARKTLNVKEDEKIKMEIFLEKFG